MDRLLLTPSEPLLNVMPLVVPAKVAFAMREKTSLADRVLAAACVNVVTPLELPESVASPLTEPLVRLMALLLALPRLTFSRPARLPPAPPVSVKDDPTPLPMLMLTLAPRLNVPRARVTASRPLPAVNW